MLAKMKINFFRNKVRVGLALTSLIIGVCVLIFFLAKAPGDVYTYRVNNMNTYKILDSTGREIISFVKPLEVNDESKSTNQAIVRHLIKRPNNQNTATYYSAYMGDNDKGNADFATYVNKVLLGADKTNVQYNNLVSGIKTYVSERSPNSLSISLGDPKQFTNSGISSDAWVLSLSGTSGDKTVIMGKIVYIVNSKSTAYFLVYSTTNNWQKNTSIWDKSLSSLQLKLH